MLRLLPLIILAFPLALWAAESTPVAKPSSTATLLSVENAVAPDTSRLSAGLKVTMEDGWKTYWRSPGEVGLPPEIAWDGSTNIANVDILYPAPTRFTAFDIENFGYGGMVLYPLQVTLTDEGQPARLNLQATLLVCAEVCIPEDFALTLDWPAQSAGIDQTSAEAIAASLARVPREAEAAGLTALKAYRSNTQLIVTATRDTPFRAPDLFPELLDASFGKPDIRLSAGGTNLWASLPTLYLPQTDQPLRVTLTDGLWAADGMAETLETVPPAPAGRALLAMIAVALIGGLILNVMPCVLPVLSLKLGHAIETATQGRERIRAGFLASAAGILSFMWVLAAIILSLKSMGQAVGWGIQFQSPVFLTLMIALMVIFAANMAGLFEITLPQGLQSRFGGPQGAGFAGDFATGALAAVMATPCSAPFLGTAVAFALSSTAISALAIFTALGLGLALPYLIFAAFPGLIAAMPRPGRWMLWVKWVLAAALAATALWLATVLWASAGLSAALASLIGTAALLTLLLTNNLPWKTAAALAIAAMTLAAPSQLAQAPTLQDKTNWTPFDQAAIANEVAQGRTVFVDVTADWCLTCKANKALVLNKAPIADLLSENSITPMVADWTRPNPEIQKYLNSFGRYGIPFNVVYGPNAPSGIPLPELLTTANVRDAISAAR